MPHRPSSLHFPLRHRRTSSAAAADDSAWGPKTANALPSSPKSPITPSSKSKRRSTFNASAAAPTKAVTAAAALQTRAELRTYVRADWSFPTPESAETPRVESDTAYVERELELAEQSRSCSPPPFSSFQTGPSTTPMVSMASGKLREAGAEAQPVDPYRFEDPDAVGAAVASQMSRWADEQRRERQINLGVRHWEDRRDAWTGAVLLRRSEAKGVVRHGELEDDALEAPSDADGRPVKRRRISLPLSEGDESPSSPSSASESDTSFVTLIPRPKPIIPPSHPIRSQITPNSYRSIYTRIVLQGTAPSIPVNLSDIISACVVGWKADGEWPSRTIPAEALAIQKRGKPDALATAVLGKSVAKELQEPDDQQQRSKRRSRRISSFIGGDRDKGGAAATLDGAADAAAINANIRGGQGVVNGEVLLPETLDPDSSADSKGLSVVSRGVRRVGRALRMVGSAMLEGDNDEDRLEGDVPGLVQGELGGTFDDGPVIGEGPIIGKKL